MRLPANGITADRGRAPDCTALVRPGSPAERRQLWTQQGPSWSAAGAAGARRKATRSRCPPTATPPSSAGTATTTSPARRGCSPAAAASGPSRAASWSAPAPSGAAEQGISVALSADGNTAIVGGPVDNARRRGVGLHPQRRRLDPAGRSWSAPARSEPPARHSVALSADGNTAIVGGPDDNATPARRGCSPAAAASGPSRATSWSARRGRSRAARLLGRAVGRRQHRHRRRASRQQPSRGAAWVFTRSGGLDPAGQQAGRHRRGRSASRHLGRAVGRRQHRHRRRARRQLNAGAAWVFTRSGGVWTQQGSKLVGTARGNAQQGISVALSADGNTAIVGGPETIGNAARRGCSPAAAASGPNRAASWSARARSGTRNKAGPSTLSADGSTAIVGGFERQQHYRRGVGLQRPAARDFNGDGKSDIVWRQTAAPRGDLADELAHADRARRSGSDTCRPTGRCVGQTRLQRRRQERPRVATQRTARTAMWLINGLTVSSTAGRSWPGDRLEHVDTGDFNGDGKSDLLWRNTPTGQIAIWLMNGLRHRRLARSCSSDGESWRVIRTRRLQRRRQERPPVAHTRWQHRAVADQRAQRDESSASRAGRRRPAGIVIRTATSTATARATSCGNTPMGARRSGS